MVRKPILILLAAVLIVGGVVFVTRSGKDSPDKPKAPVTNPQNPQPGKQPTTAQKRDLMRIMRAASGPRMTRKQVERALGKVKIVSKDKRGPTTSVLYELPSGIRASGVYYKNRLVQPLMPMPPVSRPASAK